MRNKCTRTLSLLSVIVFIGLSSSMAAEIPVVRGQLHPPAHELVQGLFVSIEEGSTHMEISRVDARDRRQLRVSRYSSWRLHLACHR